MTKKWVVREKIPDKISKKMEIEPELLRTLLFYRGIENKKDAEAFLCPDYEKSIQDPFKMLGMEKGVDRILKAVKENERIVVYGDYDADGVCAGTIIHDFFQKIGFENFHVHIPDRYKEGYGLNLGAIDEFIKDKTGLIVTFDCGITDREEVDKANSAGIDVIITDHHQVPDETPKAFAIINARQKKDKYPFKELSGAGMAFKLVQALVDKGGFNITPGWEKWLLDAVAIAAIADMVPLVDENRALVFYGLKVLRKTQRPGLLSLYKRMNIAPANIVEDDVGFMIAPRINTASRMGHASTSFSLMITQSLEEANWVSGHLDGLNNERKAVVEEILKVANERIKKYKKGFEIIIEGDKEWLPGVLGLAANKLMDKYRRPVFLWGQGESKEIKASGRSLPECGVNLVELMGKLPKDLLGDFGGHVLAAGFSVAAGKGDELKKEILKAYEKLPKEKGGEAVLFIDKEISIDEVSWSLYSVVEKLQPFGKDNPKPVFVFRGVEIDKVKAFGNGGIHLQLEFKKNDGKNIPAIGFFIANGEKFSTLEVGQKIDLAATLEKSMFRNFPELRLRIVDVKKVS